MTIQKVGVVGCGLMGSGIAQTAAQSGLHTVVTEAAQEFLDRGMQRINAAWDTMQAKGKLSAEDVATNRGRLQATLNLEDLRDCDIVVEAIIENKDEKVTLFRALDSILKPDALLVSNTSSLPITDLAAVTKRPAQVAGLHFFNPVPVMQLVEIVRALETSDTTIATLQDFAKSLGKTAIIARDTAGFVVNFLLIPYLLSAIRMYEQGVATKEDIDTSMRLGTGYPMGPFTLLDYVGLDTTLYAAEVIYAENPDPAYAPPALLRRMVAAGHLGKKSGKGFYDYSKA
ncbi:MAG TPA: 3-hydroxybutyryl-CoA dehydrogenase [Ktedonobacterales bacterium]|nr:3-hydroxybutyryl-CoA dehydrogenase [Ktedonobacterales bacterium]